MGGVPGRGAAAPHGAPVRRPPRRPGSARRGRSTTRPAVRAPGSPRVSSCWCSTSRPRSHGSGRPRRTRSRRRQRVGMAGRDAHGAGGRRTAHQPGGLPRPLRRAGQGLDRPRPGPLAGALLVRRRGHGGAAAAADRGRRGARRLPVRHPAGAGRRVPGRVRGPGRPAAGGCGHPGPPGRRTPAPPARPRGGRRRPVAELVHRGRWGRLESRIRDLAERAPGCRAGPRGAVDWRHGLRGDVARAGAGRTLVRVGRLLPAAVDRRRGRAARLVHRGRRGPRAAAGDRRPRQPGRLVGRRRRGRPCSPAPTSTASSTAVRTTARWAWSPGWRRSTCCASAGSSRPGRWGCRCSSRRRGRASASPASARGWRPATLDWAAARELRDRDGTALPDALAAAGLGEGARWDALDRVGCFVELHVEQGRDLVDRGAAVGVGSGIWPHGRYRFDFAGEANHAGTTRMEDRHDPMLTYAMTALAAAQAGAAGRGAGHLRPGRGRAQRHQRGAVAGHRAGSTRGPRPGRRSTSWSTVVSRQAQERAGRDGTRSR